MEKKSRSLNKRLSTEERISLKQLSKSLEEAIQNLEEAYAQKDYEKFREAKHLILKLQNQIQKIII